MKTISKLATIFSICFGMMIMIPAMAFGAPPVNDNFADAIEITGASGQITGTNVDATREEGYDPAYSYYPYSVWWTWTAPAAGYYTFDTDGSDFWTMLDVYTGSTIQDLITVTSNYGGRETFYAQSGTQYFIAVSGQETGNIILNWRIAHPPINDNFINAIEITGTSGSVSGTGIDATFEAGELVYGFGKSVWWKWTAPATGNCIFDSIGTDTGGNPDAILLIYTGSDIQHLNLITYNIGSSETVLEAEAGIQYFIVVDGPGKGTVKLNWKMKIPPVNDNFANAIQITGTSGQITGTNIDATCEETEPNCYYGSSVWWTWTAPAAGNYIFDISESDFTTMLTVYTGSDLANLTKVASGDSKLSFSAEAGITYHISANRYESGNIVLNWEGKLGITSVYPSNGIVGKNLPITITGSNFDSNTRVSMYSDSENTKAIIGSVAMSGFVYDISVSGSLAYVSDDLAITSLPLEVKPVSLINDKTLSVTLPSPLVSGNYTIRVFNNDDSAELTGAVTFDMPGVVSGQITDIYGNPIPNALIRTTNQDSALSQADGRYRLICRFGNNVITVAAAGYYEMQQVISVSETGSSSLNFRLTPLPPPLEPSYQPTPEERGSIAVGEDLALNICARYHGRTFGMTMNFMSNPHGLSGAFWKADPATLKQIDSTSSACIEVGDDLTLNIRAEYRGAGYAFPMSFYPYPDAASVSEFFWKADPASLRVIY